MRISYSLHGVRFSIEAGGLVADSIAATVMPACVRARGSRGETRFAVRANGAAFAVVRGRKLLWHAASEAELIPWLEWEIVNWLLGKLRRYVQIHAAAVEQRGGAVLIAGPPDSGKTSLACALGLLGWCVMSDEVALIEPRGPAVLSFPRAMLVKSGTARRLPELRRVGPRRVVLDDGPESIRYVNAAALFRKIRKQAKISAIAFPEWSTRSFVEAMGEREALERLLEASFNADRRPKHTVDTCIGLVRNSRLLRVRIGKLCDAARALSGAMGAER